jgi:hypothetical protein
MLSSGTSAITTNSTASVQLLSVPSQTLFKLLAIINEGTTAGFFSIDNGTTWARLPAGAEFGLRDIVVTGNVLVKRDSSDLSGIFGWAYN